MQGSNSNDGFLPPWQVWSYSKQFSMVITSPDRSWMLHASLMRHAGLVCNGRCKDDANAHRCVHGCRVQVWSYSDQARRWEQEPAPMAGGHSDWVRDVAWAPSLGLPFHTIASAGQVRFSPQPLHWPQPET